MQPTEEWRAVAGFPDYWVSDQGRVASHRRRRVREVRGGRNQRGYRLIHLLDGNGRLTARTVHRLVAAAFLGDVPAGKQIRHLDGDKDNNAVTNLAYGTASQNAHDQVAHGAHNMARKTHCPQGHPYDEENTRRYAGRRYCIACARARRQERAA